MNTNLLLLSIVSLLLATLSLPLLDWAGEGWAFGLHASHFVGEAYIIVVLFAHEFPKQIVMVLSGAMALGDFMNTFLSGLILTRCLSTEVPACFERLPQSILGLFLGGLLTLAGVWKVWSARTAQAPPTEAEMQRRHTVLHLLGFGPYILYATLPVQWTSFPIARGAFAFLCLAARWGGGELDETIEKWASFAGLVCSGVNLLPVDESAWAGEVRAVSLWFFIVLDCAHIALLRPTVKEKAKQA